MNAAPAVHAPDDVVIWCKGRAVSAAQVYAQAGALAQALPRARYAINLCERRSNFLTAFLAAAQREQVSLLPPSRAPLAVREIQDHYPDHCLLDDLTVESLGASPRVATPMTIPGSGPIAIAFTSGTTGHPTGHEKDWSSLLATARLAHQRFLSGARRFNVVATVPPQHMYGFETTVTLILLSASAVSDGRPLFPADVLRGIGVGPAAARADHYACASARMSRCRRILPPSGAGYLRNRATAARACGARGATMEHARVRDLWLHRGRQHGLPPHR